MARRRAGKAKPKSAVPREARGKAKEPDAALRERLDALERERDALRAALEVEQAHRRKLEEVHAAARDRIAWALDTLQSIIEPKS